MKEITERPTMFQYLWKKTGWSSLPKFNVVREFLHSLGNVVGVVVPRILDDG